MAHTNQIIRHLFWYKSHVMFYEARDLNYSHQYHVLSCIVLTVFQTKDNIIASGVHMANCVKTILSMDNCLQLNGCVYKFTLNYMSTLI